ncbi:hypothetical protein [Roseomonas haemaphysalidis]|uniref:PcRGLX/YetA-like N-terminal RIFT barrel domain-containing protein n=1 Tax=Roseomonas haemaphysalidis TaxID=2768162 RepID=A0ABS3KNQ1_9PROT|nr:hypothetical protein [Roseomonas haemaphysalidis]MBO1079089.1 hypothetical protein [Roseomonas haemaphysalidis]
MTAGRDDGAPAFGRRAFAFGLAATGLGAGLLRPGAALAANRPSFPCPSRPGDIVGLLLEGGGGPAGSVATFGQAFRPGDLPAGRSLQARLTDGQSLPVQVDVRNTHPDGSVRTAGVAIAAPALANGQMAGVLLSAGPASQSQPLAASAWAQRQAAVQVTGDNNRSWRLELMPLLPAALERGRAWQSGPLAVQGRIEAAVPSEVAGRVSSLRLVADVAVHSDGTLRMDAWLRNDIAMRDGGGTARYTAAFLLDGQEAGRFEIGRHWQYTAWGRLAVARGQTAGNAPRVLHDAAYLADAGAVARYDLRTGVDDAVLGEMSRVMADRNWATPLTARSITQNMHQTGGRGDIGPATQPQTVWLMTGDRRAAAYAIGQAEAAGSVPWHFWDPAGGSAAGGRNRPGPGGWLDTLRWPRLWTDGRGGPPPGGLTQNIASDTGWEVDSAHQPDLGYVPYLLTGRRAFLDGLQAQAAWSVISQWPAVRETPGGESVNVVRGNQVRGAAWSLRQLDNAAWTAPDNDPNREYFRVASAGNWAWIRSNIPKWTQEQGELHGCIPGVYGANGALPPWQQDYFASTAAAAARRGNGEALAVLRWMENFLAGRFLAGSKGFSPRDGAAYLIASQENSNETRPLRTWAETGQTTRRKDMSNGDGWAKTQGDYAQLALQSLAALVDLTGTTEARNAYAWLSGAGAPFTRQQDYRRDPIFNIVPKTAGPRC